MNLTEMRARVREDLKDTDSETYIWTDDEVDGALQRAVLEYSLHAPIEQQDDVTTSDGDNELDISGLAGLLQVVSIEFPLGKSPRYMQHFDRYAGHLYMEDVGDGTDARVRWTKIHTLAAESSTIPSEHEEILVLGATGHLAMSASAYTVDRATIAGRYGTQSFRLWARDRMSRYDHKLKAISRSNKVTGKTLFTQDD